MPTAICAAPSSISARACFDPPLPVSSTTRDPELGADALDREEMLLGERLGRRHQRPLTPGLDSAQQRVERDDRLARADVALEQPLHRAGPAEVGVDLARRACSWCAVSSNGSTAR